MYKLKQFKSTIVVIVIQLPICCIYLTYYAQNSKSNYRILIIVNIKANLHNINIVENIMVA